MPKEDLDLNQELVKRLTNYVREHATVAKVLQKRCPLCKERRQIEKLAVAIPVTRWWRCTTCGHLWASG